MKMHKYIFSLLALLNQPVLSAESGSHQVDLVIEPETTLNLFGNTTGSLTSTDLNFADYPSGGTTGLTTINKTLGTLAFGATGLPAGKTACKVAIESTESWKLVNATATQTGTGQPGRPIPYTIHANSPAASAINSGGVNPAEISASVSGDACNYSAPLIFNMSVNYTPEAGTYTDTLRFTTSVI